MSDERRENDVSADRIEGGRPRPDLRAVPGGKRRPESAEAPGDRDEITAEAPDAGAVRPAKVAEARIKILNDYYSRRDIQRRLAERLVLELGA